MAICLEQGADLHMAQLMPLPLTVSCFSKIQIGLPFWYWLAQVVPNKRPLNGCVCVFRAVSCHKSREITLTVLLEDDWLQASVVSGRNDCCCIQMSCSSTISFTYCRLPANNSCNIHQRHHQPLNRNSSAVFVIFSVCSRN